MRILSVGPPFHAVPYRVGATDLAARAALPFHRVTVDALPAALSAIIAAADLQGFRESPHGPPQHLGEALAGEIELLRAAGHLPPRERTAAVLAGDLHPGADDDDVRGVWRAVAGVCRWVVGVAGNHDWFGEADTPADAKLGLPNAHLLDGDVVNLDGLRIGGIGGIVGGVGAKRSRSESEFGSITRRLAGAGLDLFVSHDGPNVGGTDLAGWPSVRLALEDSPATLVVRGHDHWPAALGTLRNGTQVLNVEGRVCVLVPAEE